MKNRLSHWTLNLSTILLFLSFPHLSLVAQHIDHHECCSLPGVLEESLDDNAELDKPEDKGWDVNKPFGPTSEFKTQVSEGTWMSCDVSPDGKTIVFDLLGDIYIMGIEGGEAVALTNGPAWDIQPSYSPDGQTIVFTSDRSGGDNIWTMDLSGENTHQITNESFRLLNNPVFTPDGEYIIARKHFVKSRSLGAGEMWRYHISGKGSGNQLTEKRDWQHDAGEPDVSPDGRYVYYSQDASPGKTFQYNRDPYGTIYAIDRYDTHTGETKRITAGPGGAATPQISPDGKTLAFVRRVGLKTVLFIRDLESGNEFSVFNKLNRDAQETWAIFGVHPGFGWTPDNKSVVISGGGVFWKVDVESESYSKIPFTVNVQQTLTNAIQFDFPAWEEEFQVKALRNVRVSPNGKRVVFQALGKLYVSNADRAKRKQLTKKSYGIELVPAWSPDGKQIAFSMWSDDTGGGIRIVDSKGGKPTELNLPNGHYSDVSWSPNGKSLVYRRHGGHWSRGFDNTKEPGIYTVSINDAKHPTFITKEGRNPHFNMAGDRIFLLSNEDDSNALISVDLLGNDRRVVATSTYANDIKLSPDENWISFEERYHHYVAPFMHSGKPMDISQSLGAVPVFRLTKDSGFNLQWTADSKSLYWTLGSELFSRLISHCFDFVENAPDSLPEPDSTGISLGWKETSDVPKGIIALTGARIITMDSLGVLENATIILKGNRILNIGPSDGIKIPFSAKKIDVTGKTIIPGFVDVHAHMGVNWDGIQSEQRWQYMANLAFGVTTTHDPSNDTELIFANSERQKAGKLLAPRIFSTGTILYGAQTDFTAEINSLEDARSHLKRIKAFGGFSVKSYNQPRRDQRQQVLKAARELNMLVVPEGGSTFQHNLNMIVDGHTGIEHSLPVSPLYRDVAELFSASHVGYTPTLVVSYGGLWGENYWYQHQNVFEHEHLQQFMPQALLDQKRRRKMVEDDDYNFIENAKAAKTLLDAGVIVNNGAHGQLAGLGVHWEMWMMAQGGMTPLEALEVSTLNGAKYIGMENDIGSLSVGKLADLIILNKNPLENIQNSDSVEMVMLNGRLYNAKTLAQVAPEKTNAPSMWWK
ncbi:MAG: PD40 domain-containing protein [Candidatus Marinimicrobia bacterium]|nr:PD40 domain-containing protein [Candidatus Neomarinimicrobiota bacterium]